MILSIAIGGNDAKSELAVNLILSADIPACAIALLTKKNTSAQIMPKNLSPAGKGAITSARGAATYSLQKINDITIATVIDVQPVLYQPLRRCLSKARAWRSRSLSVLEDCVTSQRLKGEKGCCHCHHATTAIAGKLSKLISNQDPKIGSPTAKPAIVIANNQGTLAKRAMLPHINGLTALFLAGELSSN